MLIEIAVFNLESAIAACIAGAHRIELCSAPAEGGLTPSFATMKLARKYVKIPIHVMIRPREGDFCYSEKEYKSMLLDISASKIAGMDGVVLGILNPYGTVDLERTRILAEAASPMNVTFHRAFDMARDQYEALETVVRTGCARILTSGGQPTAPEGIEKIAALTKIAGNRISIMPGSGIKLSNIKQVAEMSCATEIHLSARTFVHGKMKFKQPAITMWNSIPVSDVDLQLPDILMIEKIVHLFE